MGALTALPVVGIFGVIGSNLFFIPRKSWERAARRELHERLKDEGLDGLAQNIQVVRQAHYTTGDDWTKLSPEVQRATVKSQLAVFEAVSNSAQRPVFIEGLTVPWTPKLRDKLRGLVDPKQIHTGESLDALCPECPPGATRVYYLTQRLFPDGVEGSDPREAFSKLTDKQKQSFCDIGGGRAAWALGKVGTLHAPEMDRVGDRAGTFERFSKLKPSERTESEWERLFHDVFQKREVEALVRVARTLRDQKKDSALLVFGAGHDYEEYSDSELSIDHQETVDRALIEKLSLMRFAKP